MSWLAARRWFPTAVLLLSLGFSGCDFLDRGKTSEETELNFTDGMTAKRLLDHNGAIGHFENALKVNPASGAAHRELGLLYDAQKNDFIRALYHYQRYQELRPGETNPVIAGRLFHCKVMLAREYASYLDRQQNQTELEDLRRKFHDEEGKVEMLKRQLAAVSALTNATSAQFNAALSVAATNGPAPLAGGTNAAARLPAGRNAAAAPGSATQNPVPATATKPATPGRTYTVKSGDTLARIARQYGVTLDALQKANPRIDPRAMKVGQPVVIPGK